MGRRRTAWDRLLDVEVFDEDFNLRPVEVVDETGTVRRRYPTFSDALADLRAKVDRAPDWWRRRSVWVIQTEDTWTYAAVISGDVRVGDRRPTRRGRRPNAWARVLDAE